ncbi:MAG: MgtC/SapB family protein [Chloroflexota bacterium]
MESHRHWSIALLLGLGVLALAAPEHALAQSAQPTPVIPAPFDQATQVAQQVLGTHSYDPLTAIGRLLLAAFLGAIIAYRRRLMVEEYILQAHVIISFTGALMMIIIGNEIVRAFGLLGAGNIVRYRTPVRDPQALASLFVTMGVGIAVGVGLWEMGIAATVMVVLFQFVFGHLDRILPGKLYQPRKSYELSLSTESPEVTLDQLRALFAKEDITFTLLEYELARKDKLAKMSLKVIVPEHMNTEQLSIMILKEGVQSVSWEEGQ